MSQHDTRADLRRKLPVLASRADNGSRLAAIRLQCIECMGGCAQDARQCAERSCWLWPHRGRSWQTPLIVDGDA